MAILNAKPSNYDTDAFGFLFEATRELLPEGAAAYGGKLGAEDEAQNFRDTAYRAIADHVRCLCFALADGATISNEGARPAPTVARPSRRQRARVFLNIPSTCRRNS